MARRQFLCAAALALMSTTASSAQPPAASSANDTRESNLRAYVELLRSDVRGQKVAVLTDVMQFTEAEDAAFWPIYREYELELAKLNDERVTLIKDYAARYDSITDEVADSLIRKALDLEARRHSLKAKVYERVKTALSAKTAARFIQVEHQLLAILDLQIASSLPIVK